MLQLSVGDVWQLAAEISTHLEKLTVEIGIDKIQGVVNPTVKALELLEKLADERSRLLEEKLTADKLIQSLRSQTEAQKSQSSETIEASKSRHDSEIQGYMDEKLNTKNSEILRLQKIIAEHKINESNHQTELSKQRQMLISQERKVTELSDELRIKAHIRQRFLKGLECAIRELENDCDTLENEANRLLSINKDLRSNMLNGNGKISDELGLSRSSASDHDHVTDQSFAAEIEESENETSNLERPGPEGEEVTEPEKSDIDWTNEPQKITRNKSELSERDRPRYTLYELEEVLNEKNKFKERCFVLEEKLREVTGDDTITWEGLSINDLETVETSTGTRLRSASNTMALEPPADGQSEGTIRKLMTKLFRSPSQYRSINPEHGGYVRSEAIDDEIST